MLTLPAAPSMLLLRGTVRMVQVLFILFSFTLLRCTATPKAIKNRTPKAELSVTITPGESKQIVRDNATLAVDSGTFNTEVKVSMSSLEHVAGIEDEKMLAPAVQIRGEATDGSTLTTNDLNKEIKITVLPH